MVIEPRIREFSITDSDISEPHNMVFYDWGSLSRENVVVCVHGMTRNGRDFDYLARDLVSHGFRVICPDISGRGKSPWLQNAKHYGYPMYVEDMVKLLHHLGIIHAHWVGTSMGGVIGMLIAGSAPYLIDKLVLNDVGPFIPKASLERIAQNMQQEVVHLPSREAAKAYLHRAMSTFGITQEEHWNYLMEHGFTQKEDGSYIPAYDPRIGWAFWNKRGKLRKIVDIDMWAKWNFVHNPTLVLRGERSDLLLKETADEMGRREIVHDVITFYGVGHAPMLMSNEQITPVRDWLLGE